MKPNVKVSLLVGVLACCAVGLTAIPVSNHRNAVKPAPTDASSPPTALTATAVTSTVAATPAIETPSAPSAPAPTLASKGQITVVLQRPTVPGGSWTLKQGNTVRHYPDHNVTPKLRALVGNDRAATLLVHIDADGSVKVFRRLD